MIDQAKHDEWTRLAAACQRWHDDDLAQDQVCTRCRSEVHCPGDLEPTPMCDGCCQTVVYDALEGIAHLESLYTAASSTADSLEAINEAQVERARRHNEEVQAVIEGSAKVHSEDQAMIVGYRQTVATLEIDLQATAAGAVMRHEEDMLRIRKLEDGLREACDWSTRPGLVGVDVRFNVPHEAETVPRFTRIGDRRISGRMAALRDLAGEP